MLVVVGRVGRAHGVRGEVAVEIRTDEPDRRFVPGAVLRAGETDLVVASSRPHSGRLLVTFEGVDDRTAVEAFRGVLLEAERPDGERPEDPDEFYVDDLVGLRVNAADGSDLGVVEEVWYLPAQEVLVVRRADGGVWHLPFVQALVPEVDLAGGRLVANPPDGLVED